MRLLKPKQSSVTRRRGTNGTTFVEVPNPFRYGTRIDYVMPAAGRARLTVLDLQGRVVATPPELRETGFRSAGSS